MRATKSSSAKESGGKRSEQSHREAQVVEVPARSRESIPTPLEDSVDLVLPTVGGQQDGAAHRRARRERHLLGKRGPLRPPHQRDGLRPLRQELFDAGDGAAPVQCFGAMLERGDAVPQTEQIVTHACRPAHWIGQWIAQEHDLRSRPPCVNDAQLTQ